MAANQSRALLPGGGEGDALGAVGVGGEGGEFAEVGDDLVRDWRAWCVSLRGSAYHSSGAGFGKGVLDGRGDGVGEGSGEGWITKFLVAVLELVELVVEAALGEELLVGAALAELALVHDEDGVGGLDGGEAVGDEDAGAAGDHAREGEADAVFGVGVDGAGGLVEDEDGGRVGEGAGEADELLLAGGEGGAALADGLVEAGGEGADEVGDVDFFGGVFEVLRR